MKAVLRLTYSYFTCTPAQKALSALGLVLMGITYVMLRIQPESFVLGVLALTGAAAFFLGSATMPLMFGRMTRSHASRLLPGARIKLLVSALLTIVIAALPTPVLFVCGLLAAIGPTKGQPTAAEIQEFHNGIIQTFWSSYADVMLLVAWLYVALWFITSKRNTLGFLQGLIVIAVLILAPTRRILDPQVLMWWDLTRCGITLGAFSLLFLLWPRLAESAGKLRSAVVRPNRTVKVSRVRGREIDLLLGTSNPWLLAIGQLLPVLLAARIGFYSAAVWLFYLTIFSTVAGAIAGQAAERSRALWLRGDWTTVQLFALVERSFWRHNHYVLGILLILMVVIGSYAGLSVILLATGLPLLILGTILSTYLGLMITRGLRLTEAAFAIGVMLALMAVAVLAARNSADLVMILLLEGALAVVALILRHAARRRWSQLDWMECRPDRALRGRSAA
jgi:hypothetical protein